MSFAANAFEDDLREGDTETNKAIHVVSRTQSCSHLAQYAHASALIFYTQMQPVSENVFCLRERDLLERFTSEVAQLQGRGESRESSSSCDGVLQNHELVEDLGKAFTEKAILQTILDAEANYLLAHRRDNVGDVRREVLLCGEVRPHALALVTIGDSRRSWDPLRSTGSKPTLGLQFSFYE
ncbi:hypothetical protein Bca52824_061747 [Brassica carinata]|uniref:Uncharacterized protein n=1 Tax=Brassica carinata TaxID=52824 RepID=A0A8X7QD79_BRACI|nr:hypothetical protein Bca52824_061747 [Brassica carinata]